MKDDLTLYIKNCVFHKITPNYNLNDEIILDNIFNNHTRLEFKPICNLLKNKYKKICKENNSSTNLKGTMKEDILKYIIKMD